MANRVNGERLVVSSPNGVIELNIYLGEKIYQSVKFKSETVLEYSPLSIQIDEVQHGVNPILVSSERSSVNRTVGAVWGSRNYIEDAFNSLILNFKGGYSVEFRVFDLGVAYRFVTRLKESSVTVNHEEVNFRFKFGVSAWMLDGQSYERNYVKSSLDAISINDFKNSKHKIYLPMVVQASPDVKVLITEADLFDYPSLFLDRGNDYENFLTGTFEKYALTTKVAGFSNYSEVADQEADFIAKTKGSRTYPWRLLVISDDDRTFADCDLIYQLATPNVLADTDWIRPGKVAWDWWHDYAVEKVDFKGGVNTETYLYHIDFAAKYGLEYIMIDWLWTDKYDLTLINPEVDVQKVIAYGKSKNVGTILWCPGHTLYKQLNVAMDLFASLGAAGIKVDFFGREDQTGIRMYEEIAAAAAKRRLLVDFHGSTKPTGLSRTYPNIVNYEAVAGNEWNKLNDDKITVAHKVILPFIRGLQGPMDFTPGGMRNMQSGHNLRFTLPLVHGTRCNELSLFVLYNEPLKMLCDAPWVYDQEPETARFIARIPTTWDDTKVLSASFGEFLVTARRKNREWYIGGLNNDIARWVDLKFDFLDADTRYQATIYRDGMNAHRIGTDYKLEAYEINQRSVLPLHMAKGGGFVVHLIEQ